MNVEIVNNRIKDVPRLESPEAKKGKALAGMIGRFDNQAGYPFAWYFYMLKGLVSPHVGEAVHRDISKDFAYLPRARRPNPAAMDRQPILRVARQPQRNTERPTLSISNRNQNSELSFQKRSGLRSYQGRLRCLTWPPLS